MSAAVHGTTEPPASWRLIRAGRLSFELEAGAVRNVRIDGVEVLRGIAFVVRDAGWVTVPTTLEELSIERHGDAATIYFRATAKLPGGALVWRSAIMANADGLVFHAKGSATAPLTVNRAGFVVLHPLEGVVGRKVEVEHSDGRSETLAMPRVIAPDQPAFDVAGLTHEPVPGLTAKVSLFGDTFEMEDQRNWTEASFKTYARPLAQPRPFQLAAGEAISQSVRLTMAGSASPPHVSAEAAIEVGAAEGTMPEIALVIDSGSIGEAPTGIAELAPNQIWLQLDCADPDLDATIAAARALTSAVPLTLDLVIDARDPARELAVVAAAKLEPACVVVVARRDLKARPSHRQPAGEASAEQVARATRAAFPSALIGGGVRANFAELNRNPPYFPGLDVVAHATSAIVHAADDRSVMQTLEAFAPVIASVRTMAPGALHHLSLCAIGTAENPYGDAPAPNPAGIRVVGARRDPRHFALFGAAWAVGVLEAAARGGVGAVSFGHAGGDFGMATPAITPLGQVARLAAAAANRPRLRTPPVAGLACVAWLGPRGPELLLANLTGTPRPVPGLDGTASLLENWGHGWGWAKPGSGELTLGPYAVARVLR